MIRPSTKTFSIPLATVTLVLAVANVASAQWAPDPWKKVPRTADGKVDLNAPAQRTAYDKLRPVRLLDAGQSDQASAESRSGYEAGGSASQAVGARPLQSAHRK